MHQISTFVRGAVQEVFSTMVSLETQVSEAVADDQSSPCTLSGITGSVSFTGKMTGILYLNFSGELPKYCASFIMGTSPNEMTQEEIYDVVGELTNMVTGNLKSKMTDKGFNCQLSIPSVMKAELLSVTSRQSPLSLYNEFSVPSLKEIIRVNVFARLEE